MVPHIEAKNEQPLCAAVISLISTRRGEAITNAEPLDTVVRTRPAVEWLFETPTARFALEHTRIESFQNQLTQSKQFAQLLGPLETELAGQVPGVFFLIVDVGAAKVPITQHVPVRKALGTWILTHATELDAEEDTGPTGNCQVGGRPAGTPFDVKLHRDSSYDSRLFIMQRLHGDLDVLRRERVREALRRKCPKLLEQQATGRVSILILESDDIALANRKSIAEAVVAELSLRSDTPDIVVWTRTSTSPWEAWFLKEGTSLWPEIEEAGPFIVSRRQDPPNKGMELRR